MTWSFDKFCAKATLWMVKWSAAMLVLTCSSNYSCKCRLIKWMRSPLQSEVNASRFTLWRPHFLHSSSSSFNNEFYGVPWLIMTDCKLLLTLKKEFWITEQHQETLLNEFSLDYKEPGTNITLRWGLTELQTGPAAVSWWTALSCRQHFRLPHLELIRVF